MSSVSLTEFVAGWNVVQTLGEGAFGEVKLLINQSSGEAVAMKIVDLNRHPEAVDAVRKEVCLHRVLKHNNVINFFGSRIEGRMQYMFLAYAAGGELFDRIEPDVGMPETQAQKYFRDLISGVEYLHLEGVTHRDIKPENLLLDANDVLKITDFGMATLFRYNGKERELEKRCGTKPYMAPEVFLLRPYSAEPSDVWSCGVVLVALLAGELPWDEPTCECREFSFWKDREKHFVSHSPWSKIDNLALSLLRKILNTTPRFRATIVSIKRHTWMKRDSTKAGASHNTSTDGGRANKRIKSFLDGSSNENDDLVSPRLAMSQPDPHFGVGIDVSADEVAIPAAAAISFSQPANPDHLLLSTQLSQGTQDLNSGGRATHLQRLVRRMTRVLVKTNVLETLQYLENELENSNYTYKKSNAALNVTTQDRRGARLVFKASVISMGCHVLVDFRLSKGCGLDFKRHFMKIKEKLVEILVEGPVTWSMALANNMLPA